MNLNKKAHDLARHLNSIGFSISNVLAYEKGSRVLFKKVKENWIFLTCHLESDNNWNSGVMLRFIVSDDDKLKFYKLGAFGIRSDSNDTVENNNYIEKLANSAENYWNN